MTVSESAVEDMSYASYCGDCGRMVAAIVDCPEVGKKEVAKHVAQSMRKGCRVERITCQAVRESKWGCTDDCPCKWCVKRRAKANRLTARNAQLEISDGSSLSDLLGPTEEEQT